MKKRLQKTIGALLAAVMLFSSACVFAQDGIAAEDEKLFAALARLAELGMVGSDTFVPEDTMTRSEMFVLALKANPWFTDEVFSAAAAGKSLSFTDVSENHAAYGQLTLMEQLGLVKGDGNGNVRADDAVTYSEAITFLVRLTGYEATAAKNAEFPDGQLAVAADTGISKGISAEANEPATQRDIIIMINNAMDVPIMVMSGYNAQTKETSQTKSERTLAKDIISWREQSDPNKINPSDEAVNTDNTAEE